MFGGSLNWGLIGLGAAIGAVVIVIDEVLGRFSKLRLPPLAVGMGMYLPMSLTLLIPIGALLGRVVRPVGRAAGRQREFKKRLGVLAATGLIVGESLFGVVFAAIVAASGSDSPLAVVGGGASRPRRSSSAWCCSWWRCSRCTSGSGARLPADARGQLAASPRPPVIASLISRSACC